MAAAVGVYLWSHQETERIAMPFEAVHPEAEVVIGFNSLHLAAEPLALTDYAGQFAGAGVFGEPWQRLMLLDSLLAGNAALHHAQGVIFISPQAAGGYVTVLRPTGLMDSQQVIEAVDGLGLFVTLGNGSGRWKHHPASGTYLTVTQGLLLMASDSTELRACAEVLASGNSLATSPRFTEVMSSAGKNVQMNVYLRFPSQMLTSASLWNHVGDWLILDLGTHADGVVMNGFAHPSDSSAVLLGLFKGQQPGPIRFTAGVPSDVTSFMMFSVDDVAQWHSQLLALRGRDALIDSLNELWSTSVVGHFAPWMSGQFGVCRIQRRGAEPEQFAMIHASNTELADALLHGLASLSGTDSAEVRSLGGDGLLRGLFGPVFPEGPMFFARHGEFVVFGPSEESVRLYCHDLRADRTLATDVAFAAFSEQFSSSFNVFGFQRLPLEKEFVRAGFSEAGSELSRPLLELADRFPMFGVQFSNAGGAFYCNMHWRYDPDWQSSRAEDAIARMDAMPQGRPKWFRNHVSGEPEILVQDRKNILYLFNRSGQELFRRELPEPMVGEAVQVDRYKNGNLQFVFCTNNFIYQIDRNGEDVTGFPKELESPVSAPMLVVDYNAKRNYRMLVACKNNRVYNYGIDGQEVKGWKFNKLSKGATSSFAYMMADRKDYFVISETGGRIHLLDRAGGRRASVKETIERNDVLIFHPHVSKKNEHTGFYTTDKDGTVFQIKANGRTRLLNFGKFSPEHRFLLTDMNGDDIPEFGFTDLNMLKVFSQDGKLLVEHRLAPGAIGPLPITWDGHSAIAIVEPDEARILAFASDGSMLPAFPIEGMTEFDMVLAKSGERLLVTGIDRGLMIHILE